MKDGRVKFIVSNPDALRVAASAARISTQPGTALALFEGSRGDERDLRLIGKVLSSGHASIIEHQTLSAAFDNVSVLVEQFVIESRLASFTVKSRRYVDFSDAGFVTPETLTAAQRERYEAVMRARFVDYQALLDRGIPREDARFVLPYALRSNFYMTADAREWMALIQSMRNGRGAAFPEVRALGEQLKAQFDALYPGILDAQREVATACAVLPRDIADPVEGGAAVELVDATAQPSQVLARAMAFTGRFSEGAMRDLLLDARPRELETLSATFDIHGISLACLTHFTRHRVQSILIPPIVSALCGGRFLVPQTVQADSEALRIYRSAFERQAMEARALIRDGLSAEDASYLCMSGHLIDIMLTMNARELSHFMRLRTCSRAQWEIRDVARQMLDQLTQTCPELYGLYGASCRFGPCPEGRMSCGHPWERI